MLQKALSDNCCFPSFLINPNFNASFPRLCRISLGIKRIEICYTHLPLTSYLSSRFSTQNLQEAEGRGNINRTDMVAQKLKIRRRKISSTVITLFDVMQSTPFRVSTFKIGSNYNKNKKGKVKISNLHSMLKGTGKTEKFPGVSIFKLIGGNYTKND